MKSRNEFYCRECNHELVSEHRMYECPECGGKDVFNSSFITCGCGERIYLSSHTNECYRCGKLYNIFGEELAPVEEWDEDDYYDCFGPQNEEVGKWF